MIGKRRNLKVCKRCGVIPILETWYSGGFKCAVRCKKPDRGDGCDWKFYRTISRSVEDAIQKWNDINKEDTE